MVKKQIKKKKPMKKRRTRKTRKSGVPVKTLKKFYPTLKRLSTANTPSRISSILRRVPNSGIDAICECAYNAVYSKSINRKNLAKLKKLDVNTKRNIRRIIALPSNKRFKEKKQLLCQVGGGLGTIIASVLPLLLSLFKRKS